MEGKTQAGSGQGMLLRSAAGGRVAHCRRRIESGASGEHPPAAIPDAVWRMRSSRCYGMIRLAS